MREISEVLSQGVAILAVIFVIITPVSLTGMNIFCLIKPRFVRIMGTISWSFTVLFGIILTTAYSAIINISPLAKWSDQLYNAEVHQPFWTDALGPYIAIAAVAVAGFAVLAAMPLRKTPPLLFVLAMGAQYPFMAACLIWCVQVTTTPAGLLLTVFPANLVIIILTMFRLKITAWQKQAETGQNLNGQNLYGQMIGGQNVNGQNPDMAGGRKLAAGSNKILNDSKLWPLFAFIAALPILGIILGISVLFGQSPDILIKAWTETAEWRLSGRTAPPNLYYDEHYLCTVAAGGHEKVVKPIRMGERHGHRVVVNRQLEIANAFEQVLEERTPHLHRFIRHIYDKYGFPIARCIRTKTACDIVYAVMKPLEWFFLCVIYLTDARPEDRIAVQYMPGYRDFQKKLKENR